MEQETQTIELARINEPAHAMREDIDRDAVFELLADIRKNGLINPITVRPLGEKYEVVAGHRRFLAHRFGGMQTIRCIVRELSDADAFAIMTSENLARVDVNPVDEATHTARLLEMNEGDEHKVANIVNRSVEWVRTRLAISKMDAELKDALRTGKVKQGVALALTKITDDIDRSACLGMAITQGASLVVVNYWVAQWEAGLFGHATAYNNPDPNVPFGERRVVMLRSAIDGKEYPATEMLSFLMHHTQEGYIVALRAHLESEASASASAAGENESGAGE